MFTSVQSKFTWGAFRPVVAGVVMPIAILVLYYFVYIANGIYIENGVVTWPAIIIVTIVCIQTGFMTWVMATRLVKLDISDYGVKAKGFYGYGPEKEWLFSNLEGYSIEHHERKNKGIIEDIILWRNDKKVLRITDEFFENYEEIKAAIAQKLESLSETGEED